MRAICAGIGLVAGRVLAGEIEDAPHIGLFRRRHAEDADERFDLVVGDDAVGLRHLGAERDDRRW